MNEVFTRITINPNVCNGKPSIRNMRFSVTQMLDLVASGMSFNDILNDYPYIEKEDIEACLRYASKIADSRDIIQLAS